MKILWASEVEKGINDCRLFTNAELAKETIMKETLDTGNFHHMNTIYDDNNKHFSMTFGEKNELGFSNEIYLAWIFVWVEVEGELREEE